MQIITKNENKILLLIKNNLTKYPESISYDTIREILDMSETEVVDLLKSLRSLYMLIHQIKLLHIMI